MSFSMRIASVLAAASSLWLGGCTSLLGDFSYDANGKPPGAGGSGNGPTPDEQGDIVVVPADGLITTEQGAKATFSIMLKRKPTESVTIALSSSNDKEGVVSPGSVTFTSINFDAPQNVQITGVDDALPDGTQDYTIKTSPAASGDLSYYGIDPIDPKVKNVDDETAGFLLTPPNGLVTTESGGEAMFTLALTHQPTADVVIPLSSDNMGEGTVSPAALTFTSVNWMAPQFVTVTGVNDDAADGPKTYHVVTGPASSGDSGYDKLNPDDETIVNQDNDTAGVTLTPATGLLTFENGAMTTFSIVLNSPPSADVSIALASSDEAEGLVTPANVVFTNLNWMAPQVVTVTGVDDMVADGNQPYKIITKPAVSDDGGYGGLDAPDAEITNIDDDTPGLIVTPTSGLVTGEDGAATSFTVALQSRPSGPVTLDVVSTRPEEGTVSPAALSFTEFNWNAPQVVMVTGVDDKVQDGMQTYTVHVRPNAMSGDAIYAALNETDVGLSNIDNDSAGVTVLAQQGLTTKEDGSTATFSIVLNSEPTKDVSIAVTSSDTSEGTVNPSTLVFTHENWAAPQIVTVKGVNDDMQDGNQPYKVVTEAAKSEDPNYDGVNPTNVDVVNIDDDSAGISVNAPNQPLTTTESGGSAQFTVVLNSQPSSEVNIPVSSTNMAEGTVNVSNLKFTLDNWRAPQTVTVKGVDDDHTADGSQQYRVALGQAQSQDGHYNVIDPPDVKCTNTDNDSAGITLKNTDNLTTKEDGSMASFQIVLNSKPTADVTIALSSNKTAEGTVTPAQVRFTGANWNAPQTVTITGVDDKVQDGAQTYRIVTGAAGSPDPNYNGMDAADPKVTNVDNDSAGISVVYMPASGITTKEAGPSTTFTIALNSQPTADVTIPVRSSNTKEGNVNPASLVFTSANYNAPHPVTVTGADDMVADGAQPYTIVIDPAKSADPNYNGKDAADVPATNVDNDSAGFTVTKISGDTKETGVTASFTIALNSQPTADVGIAISSDNVKEGTVSPASVVFTNANWNAPQKIVVTGVDDHVADGPQPYNVILAPATSTDGGYKNLDPDDVAVNNVDDDSAGISVSAAKGTTSEGGISTTFTIMLNSQPTAGVTIPLATSNDKEGTLGVTQVAFTTTDYGIRTVTITGVNDDFADGDQPYTIVVGAAMSGDKTYNGIDAPDVSVTNVDNDSAGLTVSATQGTTSEKPGAATFKFTIALTSKPSADVKIPLTSSDESEGTVSPATLTFTTDNWQGTQQVTVTGVNDDFADGSQPYSIQIGAATSTDKGYSGFDYPSDVSMSNTDDDSAGFEVSPISNNTDEKGKPATFTIALTSRPTADVTIPLSSSNTAEGVITPATVTSVTFTTNNWSAQTVTVKGVNDKVADGLKMYTIVTGAAQSTDTNYKNKNPDDVDLFNVDDDVAGITVSLISNDTTEGGISATFSVTLNSQPKAAVSIPISISPAGVGEGKLDVTSIDFTTTDYADAASHTITVHGLDDDVADGDIKYSIKLDNPTSTDTDYAAIDPDDVSVINKDNDQAGFNIIIPMDTATGESASAPPVTFNVVLKSAPKATVTIPVTFPDTNPMPAEGTLTAPASGMLVFDASNWSKNHPITVVGVDDMVVDGPVDYYVHLGPSTSSDPAYDNKTFDDLKLTNVDDDM